jgi:hypothetical protein
VQHAALAEDDRRRGEAERLLRLRRRPEDDAPRLAEQVGEVDAELLAQLVVEVRQGLVEEEDVDRQGQRAIAVRCCWPPESSAGRRSRRCSMPMSAATSRTRSSTWGCFASRSGEARFSYTVSEG